MKKNCGSATKRNGSHPAGPHSTTSQLRKQAHCLPGIRDAIDSAILCRTSLTRTDSSARIRLKHCIFSICRGQALAVALAGRRKAVPLPRIIERIPIPTFVEQREQFLGGCFRLRLHVVGLDLTEYFGNSLR